MPDFKPQFESSSNEFDPHHHAEVQRTAGTARSVDAVRLGLTVLGLLSAITILSTAGNALGQYNSTHLSPAYFLALWPTDFDIRPTVALVVCSALITIFSIASLVVSKVPSIKTAHPSLATGAGFVLPILSLFAAVVGTSFFYGVYASTSHHSMQTWTCQWSAIDMDVKPHWRTLCRESKVAQDLMIALIPVQVLVLAASAVGTVVENKQARNSMPQRKGSPAMS